MDNTNTDRLLTDREVEARFGLSATWLERRRRMGGGPTWIKLGTGRTSPVRYRARDVTAWLDANTRDGAAPAPVGP